MTKDDVIRMARDAAAKHGHTLRDEPEPETIEFLEAFHALVAAHERDECAKLCDEMLAHYTDYKDTALLNGDVELSNAASGEPRACEFLAKTIRARGNQ